MRLNGNRQVRRILNNPGAYTFHSAPEDMQQLSERKVSKAQLCPAIYIFSDNIISLIIDETQ